MDDPFRRVSTNRKKLSFGKKISPFTPRPALPDLSGSPPNTGNDVRDYFPEAPVSAAFGRDAVTVEAGWANILVVSVVSSIVMESRLFCQDWSGFDERRRELFAFGGALVWRLMEGRAPFSRSSDFEAALAHLRGDISPGANCGHPCQCHRRVLESNSSRGWGTPGRPGFGSMVEIGEVSPAIESDLSNRLPERISRSESYSRIGLTHNQR